MARLPTPPVRSDGLQLQDHRRYQERFWAAERCAWATFIAVALAAALGLTGAGGPLSRSVAVVAGGQIETPRIARWEAADSITVRFAADGGAPTLRLSPPFSASFKIEGIQPRPESVKTSRSGQTIHFATGERPAEAILHIRPVSPGLVSYGAAIGGGEPAQLSTLILP